MLVQNDNMNVSVTISGFRNGFGLQFKWNVYLKNPNLYIYFTSFNLTTSKPRESESKSISSGKKECPPG